MIFSCPAEDDRGVSLSQVVKWKEFPDRPQRIRTRISKHFLVNETKQREIFFHCQTAICVAEFLTGIEGFSKCPTTLGIGKNHCNGFKGNQATIPLELQDASLVHVSLGPADVVDPKPDFQIPPVKFDFEESPDGESACACPRATNNDLKTTIHRAGISPEMVTVIALISFVAGVCVMAILWFIHVHTSNFHHILYFMN